MWAARSKSCSIQRLCGHRTWPPQCPTYRAYKLRARSMLLVPLMIARPSAKIVISCSPTSRRSRNSFSVIVPTSARRPAKLPRSKGKSGREICQMWSVAKKSGPTFVSGRNSNSLKSMWVQILYEPGPLCRQGRHQQFVTTFCIPDNRIRSLHHRYSNIPDIAPAVKT